MKDIIGIAILCLVISACCREDAVETARYELTANEIALLPYEYGEKINFIHSKGHSFDFKVTKNSVEWAAYEQFCEWSCCGNSYYSYQVKTTLLESDYPRFQISFKVGESRSNYAPQVLAIKINHTHFIQIPYDTLGDFSNDTTENVQYYDSIYLENQLYYNVVEKEFDLYNSNADTSALTPLSIYFNDLGMLQLKMSNNETFTINN